MNKRVILIALTAMMLSTVSYAQKVIREDGAVIIDCSEMGGDFYHSDPKADTTTATNTTAGTNEETDISSAQSNAKVYKKFEVCEKDWLSSRSWADAIKGCHNLSYDHKTDWRLPTQRELMLMWILKSKLEAESGFTRFKVYEDQIPLMGYWSATEQAAGVAWLVYLDDGYINDENKTNSNNIRCIRDI